MVAFVVISHRQIENKTNSYDGCYHTTELFIHSGLFTISTIPWRCLTDDYSLQWISNHTLVNWWIFIHSNFELWTKFKMPAGFFFLIRRPNNSTSLLQATQMHFINSVRLGMVFDRLTSNWDTVTLHQTSFQIQWSNRWIVASKFRLSFFLS